jgi:hypothetical protein
MATNSTGPYGFSPGGSDDRVATNPFASPYGFSPGSKTYAADVYAALTRDQWQQYVSTFIPIENKLIEYATNPAVVSNAMATASEGVSQAYAAQEAATTRRLKGLGVSLSPDEQRAQTRSFGLSKSLADVGAQNIARELTTQRQQQILGSPAPQGVQ